MEISTLVARFSETHIQPKVRAIAPQNQQIALIAGAIFLTILFLAASASIWLRREVKKVDSNSKPDLTPLPTDKKTDQSSPTDTKINNGSRSVQEVVLDLEKLMRSSGVAAEIYSKAFEDYVKLFLKYSDDLKVELEELKAKAKGGDDLSMQLLTALNRKIVLHDYQKIKASYDAFTKGHPPTKTSSEPVDPAAGTGFIPSSTVDIPAPGFFDPTPSSTPTSENPSVRTFDIPAPGFSESASSPAPKLEPASVTPIVMAETLQEWVSQIAGKDLQVAKNAMQQLYNYRQANPGCIIPGYDSAYETYRANAREGKKKHSSAAKIDAK